MLVNVTGAKCVGIDAVAVTVEVDIVAGTGIHLVGLADTAVKESLLRTITALQALGFHIPGRKIIINLAPADLHKSGSGYDLPIAVGIIAASRQADLDALSDYLVMGELGLDGTVRDIPESLVFAELAYKMGLKGCILPFNSAIEASEFIETEVYGVRNLNDVVTILSGREQAGELLVRRSREYDELCAGKSSGALDDAIMDFSEIVGQQGAKRGIEIAAAGGHNVIMIGPPGSGKSSLAKAAAGILPPMTRKESMLTSKIWSAAGKGMLKYGLIHKRPVRCPHYSASLPAIIGGGNGDRVLPGEVSLASNGILFLDEFNQMPKSVVEALRGPLEDRKVVISRLKTKMEYPSSFMLFAAANPCPCGYWGDGDRCTCTPSQRMNYISKLSGPILDRIDLQILVKKVETERMLSREKAETSAQVAERVMSARAVQNRRFVGEEISVNAEMNNKLIEKYCVLDKACSEILNELIQRMQLSMRAYFRIIKVARTIADLEGTESIKPEHIMEASSFRILDRQNIVG